MKYQVYERSTASFVGKKYRNRNGAQNFCDALNKVRADYEVRVV